MAILFFCATAETGGPAPGVFSREVKRVAYKYCNDQEATNHGNLRV